MTKLHVGIKSKLSTVSAGAIGAGAAMVLSILLSLALTNLIIKGNIADHLTGMMIFAIRTIAVFLGCIIGSSLIDGKLLPVAGISALGYLLFLLATGIALFDGSFKSFGSGVLSVLAGAIIAVFVKTTTLRSNKHSKIRHK